MGTILKAKLFQVGVVTLRQRTTFPTERCREIMQFERTCMRDSAGETSVKQRSWDILGRVRGTQCATYR